MAKILNTDDFVVCYQEEKLSQTVACFTEFQTHLYILDDCTSLEFDISLSETTIEN